VNTFHYGPVRLFGGRFIRNRTQPIFARRTTDNSRKPAARLGRSLIFVLAFALALAFVTSGNHAAAADSPTVAGIDSVPVFGATHKKVEQSKSFRNWQRMLKRYAKQEDRISKGRARMNEKGGEKLWNDLIDRLQGLDAATQVAEVNSYFNKLTYQSDTKNYDVKDYWATPYQFLSRAKGDCEDFAAAKYFALRTLGFEASQLRLVAGYDKARGGAHAVTLVMLDGQVLMLDIGKGGVMEMAAATQFKPFYSVTESGGWLHTKRA